MKPICCFLLFAFSSVISVGQSMNVLATRALQRTIGNSIRDYYVYSSPTTNYGVGTSCIKKWAPRGVMVCDMIKNFGLDTVLYNQKAWKEVNGYAYYGETGGPIDVSDSLNNQYGVGMILPKVLSFLNITADIEKTNIRGVKLRIDSALVRNLDYGKYKEYVFSGKNKDLLEAWRRRKLIVATSDFVLLEYTLEINPIDTFSMSISAKIDSLNKLNKNLIAGGESLGFNVTKTSQGVYLLKSVKPVVFAIYRMKQRKLEGLSNETGFSDWETVNDAPDAVVDPSQVYTSNR